MIRLERRRLSSREIKDDLSLGQGQLMQLENRVA
jgi:hypothetical protein